MNGIWLALIVCSAIAAAFTGTMGAVSTASIESAKAAATLALGLVGVMAFWLGLMRVVQEGGLLHSLARWLRPVMTWLFPDVPADHPAMSAMIMNIASNMLGLGNAATPFGIKAMTELNRLNPVPGVATDAMVLFLAINTSNVALAPLGVIALRASLGSTNAAGIWLPTLLATSFSTLVAVAAAKLLQRVYRPVTAYAPESVPVAVASDVPAEALLGASRPTTPAGCAVALTVVAAILIGFVVSWQRAVGDGAPAAEWARQAASSWLLPVLIAVMLAYGMAKRVSVYDAMRLCRRVRPQVLAKP